jgi:hypothetical protein
MHLLDFSLAAVLLDSLFEHPEEFRHEHLKKILGHLFLTDQAFRGSLGPS